MDRPAQWVAVGALVFAPILGWAVTQSGPVLLAAAAVVIAGLVLTWRPILGVYGLVAGTFFDEIYVPAGFALLGMADLAAFGLLPAWLARRLLRLGELRLPQLSPLLFAYLALAFASLMLGVAPRGAYGNYARLLTYGAALLAIVDMVRTREAMEHVTLVMALCGLVHALVSVADPGPARRLMGLASQPNILGVRIALGVIPAAGLMIAARRQVVRWAWAAAVLVMLLAVLLTISRGTYLALGIAFAWYLRRDPRVALAAVAAAAIAFVVIDQVAEDRVARIEQRLDFDDSSVTNRGIVARNAITVIGERPVLGVGFGQFRSLNKVVGITSQAGRGSHNFYLGVAASTGLPALLLLVGFALAQARSIGRGLEAARRRDGPDAAALVRLSAVWQAVMVYHGASLVVRGGLRLTDWTLLGLYAALAWVVTEAAERAASARAVEDGAVEGPAVEGPPVAGLRRS